LAGGAWIRFYSGFHPTAILGKFATRMESPDIHKTAGLLQKNWGIVPPTALDWEALRLALQVQMLAMLTDDFERLVQTMYRLDVAESKFRAAMDLPTREVQAVALADIVLERELLRLETWQRYSKG
jgi:hypothetical protein